MPVGNSDSEQHDYHKSKSPGLEAYWRFNEGKGNVFEDATGKGHTITTTVTPVWIDKILSTDEATPWK